MKYLRFLAVHVWIFLPCFAHSQIISGTLLDSISGRKITEGVNIIFFEASQKEKMEFIRVTTGSFTYTLQKTYDTLIVKATSFSMYNDKILRIIRPEKGKQYNLVIRMEPLRGEQLREVVITATRKIKVKEDTIVFRAKAFSDGTEQKLKDLLPKMPGFTVDSDGQIKFQGKRISALLIEDDDLFGRSYGTGTKHIKANVVKEVEVITDYHENPLLKNISFSDQIALNIRLKDKTMSFSGDMGVYGGYQLPGTMLFDVSGTGMQISKKAKSFVILSGNNAGENESPTDFYTPYFGPDYYMEFETHALTFVPEKYASTRLGENKMRFNRQFFGNINTIFKAGKNNKIRIKFYGITDRLLFGSQETARYFSQGQNTEIHNTESSVKKPVQYRGDWQWTSKISEKSLLQYTGKMILGSINTQSENLFNSTENYTKLLETRRIYGLHKLEFTYKANPATAWQNIVQFSTDVPEQRLYLNNRTTGEKTQQLSFNNRKVLSAQLIRMRRSGASSNGWVAGYLGQWDRFGFQTVTDTSSVDEHAGLEYHTGFVKHENFIKSSRWDIKYHALGGILHFKQPGLRIDDLFKYDVALRIRRKVGVFKFYAGFGAENNIRQDYPWSKHPFIYDINKQKQYVFSGRFGKVVQFSGGVMNRNSDYMADWQLNITRKIQSGTYISHTQWNSQGLVLTVFSFYPVQKRSWQLSLLLNKFFPDQRILIHLDATGIRSEDYFSVMDRDLRQTFSYTGMLHFDISSGFTGVFNFVNKFKLMQNLYPEYHSGYTLMQNTAGILLNFGYYRINLTNQSIKPFAGTGRIYHFFDLMFKLSPGQTENLFIEIGINNIFDTGFLINKQITPYSEYYAFTPVRRRSILAGIYWDF